MVASSGGRGPMDSKALYQALLISDAQFVRRFLLRAAICWLYHSDGYSREWRRDIVIEAERHVGWDRYAPL